MTDLAATALPPALLAPKTVAPQLGTMSASESAKRVEIDKTAKKFVVTVESSLVRDLIGQRLTRVFSVSANRLVLTPADPAEGWRVTYERF